MSKPAYKLIYFDGKGRGELIRLIFISQNINYDDSRVKMEDWAALKPKTPTGQLPFLEVRIPQEDGGENVTLLPESIPIARFVANEAGIAGKTNLEKAQADIIVDTLTEFLHAVFEVIYPEINPTALAAVIAKEGTKALGNVQKLFVSNNPGGEFLVGTEMTWADICFFNVIDTLSSFGEDAEKILNSYSPKLMSIYKCVAENPNIKKWLETRPKNPW
ncbi:unnamed protein product [Owenia fusiformis]|uniref:glutathione transferase n=1 Tax=Owenia fusiformis TaxID=6347 RepID=A0A8J1YC73_OWEFU|nr:unnamed protein product [Owenia fusiformis]